MAKVKKEEKKEYLQNLFQRKRSINHFEQKGQAGKTSDRFGEWTDQPIAREISKS
jgi:hypothetical protein